MKRQLKVFLLVLIAAIVIGCATSGPMPRGKGIDQEPMYGGMDRQSVPELRAVDEQFISGVAKGFGSRQKGGEAFVEQGIRFYQHDSYSMAMKRFN